MREPETPKNSVCSAGTATSASPTTTTLDRAANFFALATITTSQNVKWLCERFTLHRPAKSYSSHRCRHRCRLEYASRNSRELCEYMFASYFLWRRYVSCSIISFSVNTYDKIPELRNISDA